MKKTLFFCDICKNEVKDSRFLYRIEFISNIREIDGYAPTLIVKDVCVGCCEAALNALKIPAKELPKL